MYRSVHDEDEENVSDPFYQELEDEDYAEVMTLFNEDGTKLCCRFCRTLIWCRLARTGFFELCHL